MFNNYIRWVECKLQLQISHSVYMQKKYESWLALEKVTVTIKRFTFLANPVVYLIYLSILWHC